VGAGIVQRRVGVGHGFPVAAGFCGLDLRLRIAQAGVSVNDESGGGLVSFGHVLRDLGQPPLPWPLEIAAVFMQMSLKQRKQARFASPIAAHQPHFFSGVEGGVGTLQHHFGAAPQRHVAQHDHAALPSAR